MNAQNSPSSYSRPTLPPPPSLHGLVGRGFALVRVLFGLLLLVAAVLKLTGDSTASLGQNVALFTPRLRLLTVETELLLGLWLLSGWRAELARWTALVFFGLLAGVSLWLALEGQSSCGCLGRIVVHPWVTFSLDLVAVSAFTVFRPRTLRSGPIRAGLAGLVNLAAGAAVLLGTMTAGLMGLWHADFDTVVARLKGEPLAIEPAVYDMGAGVRGEVRAFEIRVANRSERLNRIVGGTSVCPCAIADELPVTVPAGGTVTLRMRAKFAGTAGAFQNEFVLYADDGGETWTTTARVSGTVLDPAPDP